MRRIVLIILFAFGNIVLWPSFGSGEITDPSVKKQEREYREATKDAKRITIHEAYAIYKSGKAVLISVDEEEYYRRIRILGSVNIPLRKLEKVNLNLPKIKILLLYCR